MKSLIVNILCAVLGVCFALLLSEGTYRGYLALTSSPEPADLKTALEQSDSTDITEIGDSSSLRGLVHASSVPDIVFELKPNIRGRFLGKSLETNSFGMRGPEVSLEKPPGTLRIVGLGDSVMFGWGVEYEESYLALLEGMLSEQGVKAEVLNFAVPGYNTAMEVATFKEKAIHFDPDLVIIHFVNNDLDVPHFMLEASRPPSLLGSKLLGRVAELFEQDVSSHMGLLDIPTRQGENWDDVLEQYRHMVGPEAFRGFMRELASLCQARGIPLIFLVGSHNALTRESIARRMARRFEFEVVEALPVVNQYFETYHPGADRKFREQKLWVSPHDAHPNPLGHRLYSKALWPVVKNILLSDQESK